MSDPVLNQNAFLATLRKSEGSAIAADPYRVVYGYTHTIVDLSDHPWFTGEWKGEIITVGKYAGQLSTAAGAYQMTHSTWAVWKHKLSLNSFNAQAQDDACLAIIKSHGALSFVNDGDISRACTLLCSTWASLPGGDSGQPQRRLEELIDEFEVAGGQLLA